MIALTLAIIVFLCSLLPAVMLAVNWRAYRLLPKASPADSPVAISLLIPARNEEHSIGNAVFSAMQSVGVTLEIIVLDDDSDDGTANVVAGLAKDDPRVRLVTAPPLPNGWCGKQHACWVLSQQARHDLLVWIDADVRLAPDALARMAHFMQRGDAGLISGFPRELTLTLAERLVIPLIHFVLLGYLPIRQMRRTTKPEFAAGCGQLFMARRTAYDQAGGHAAIRVSLHDGITLPRAFRRAGIKTDLFDATDIAVCRMYQGFAQVFSGFAKNATEGMATSIALPIWTILLLGHAAAWVVLPLLFFFPQLGSSTPALILWFASWVISVKSTAYLAWRFRQSIWSWLLHPVGIVLLLIIQWYALIRKFGGHGPQWKNRRYSVQK